MQSLSNPVLFFYFCSRIYTFKSVFESILSNLRILSTFSSYFNLSLKTGKDPDYARSFCLLWICTPIRVFRAL